MARLRITLIIIGIALIGIGGYQFDLYYSLLQNCAASRVPCPTFDGLRNLGFIFLGSGLVILILGYAVVGPISHKEKPKTEVAITESVF